MSNKICIITSAHPPFDVRIFHKEAKSLVRAGYDVTIIAQHDREEIVDGVKIINLESPRNRIERMTKAIWSAFQKALAVKADIYHFHDPELIPLGLILKALGYKVIYDVHEDVPRQTLSKHYLPVIIREPLAWMISAIEWIGARAFDAIVPATPKIAEHFPSHKTVIVQNFPIINELVNTGHTPYRLRPNWFAYVGGISKIRGIIETLRALELISDVTDVRLQLAGDFSPHNLDNELTTLHGWKSVDYHGEISRQQVAHLLGSSRAGLILFHPLPNHIDAQPNKLFEYMSVGLPVIASDFPLWRKIINAARCGLIVDPLNPKEIADAMRWILEHPAEAEAMGMRGRKAVEQTYNWDAESVKLIGLYEKLIDTMA